jgi:hypothetical protein
MTILLPAIKDMYPHESWSKFLWLDYPTTQSWRKHIKYRSNWTLGCVSLENKDVEELYGFVQKGTAVEILK